MSGIGPNASEPTNFRKVRRLANELPDAVVHSNDTTSRAGFAAIQDRLSERDSRKDGASKTHTEARSDSKLDLILSKFESYHQTSGLRLGSVDTRLNDLLNNNLAIRRNQWLVALAMIVVLLAIAAAAVVLPLRLFDAEARVRGLIREEVSKAMFRVEPVAPAVIPSAVAPAATPTPPAVPAQPPAPGKPD